MELHRISAKLIKQRVIQTELRFCASRNWAAKNVVKPFRALFVLASDPNGMLS